MRTRVMPLVLTFLLAGLTACEGDSTQPVMDAPDLPAMAEDGVRAALVIEDRTDDVLTVAVHVNARGMALGSYQGRLEYDTGRYTLLSAEATTGSDGFRVANAATDGVVRFAGFTTDAFASPRAVRVRLRAPAELRAQDLTLALEVAGTVEGSAVARSHYQTPRDLYRPAGTAR